MARTKTHKKAHVDAEGVHRTCIACRQISVAEDLLRFVRAPNGSIAFDVKGHVDGRGAYTCANETCIERAVKKGGFSRAFQDSISVDFADLLADVKATLSKRILENLGLAFLAGQCVVGRTKVQEERAANRVASVMVASDLSSRSVRELGIESTQILRGPEKELVGQALGKLETGVVALLKGRISDRITCDLRRFQGLGSLSQVGE